MRFKVIYTNGKKVETEPLYFTSGISIIVTVSNDKVDVRYDH